MFKDPSITLERIYSLAKNRNAKALKFWRDTAVHIGNALVNCINLLNPRLIILGGGISNNFIFLRKTINEIIMQRAMKSHRHMVKIVRAKWGDDAGLLGAMIRVEQALTSKCS